MCLCRKDPHLCSHLLLHRLLTNLACPPVLPPSLPPTLFSPSAPHPHLHAPVVQEFVLSVVYKGRPTHHLLKKDPSGDYIINTMPLAGLRTVDQARRRVSKLPARPRLSPELHKKGYT